MMKTTQDNGPEEGARAGTSPDTTTCTRTTAAREMLSAFRSIGASAFDVTITDLHGELKEFRRGQKAFFLLESIPSLLDTTDRAERNLIVRPRGENERRFIQLDDLDAASIERVRPFAFIILETSRGNFQAWACVEDATQETARQLKAAAGADANASGAVRVCGSRNFKEKYAPHFPTIQVIETHSGRTTKREELLESGLLKEEEPSSPPARAPRRGFSSTTWPDYAVELARAPQKNDGTGIDVSRADWKYSLIAADRGFTAEEITDRLLQVSEKVRQMKENEARSYAERTAQKAAESVARRKAGQ